jgi:hypothetical protein
METMAERLSQLIVSLKINNRKFAAAIGESETKISAYRRGLYKPSTDTIINIVKNYENLNLRWFMLGEGEMWSEDKPAVKVNDQKTKIITLLTDLLVMNHDLLEHIAQLIGTEKQILINQIRKGMDLENPAKI